MTLSAESAPKDVLAEIRQVQLAQAEELKVIKGQLTDLPGISSRISNTRMDLRHDVRELREQVAELPGIRARLEDQDRQLAEIKDQLATIVSLLQPGVASSPVS
ncbi:Med9 domain-containing protein [Prauserella flavalba]|uniref:hypothetical protein n=1 Tax=Prauserella flavalba TaxID=1477506 RepID=UPI0036EB3E5D